MLRIQDRIEPTKWNDLLRNDPHHPLCLTPEMAAFYDANPNSRSCQVAVEENDVLVGMAVGEISSQDWDRFGISKKTIFYSEPFHNGNLAVLDLLLQGIKAKAEGLFIQVRNSKKVSPDELAIYNNNGFRFRDHLAATIQLNEKQEIWNGFEKDKRKGIRKALEKHRLTIVEKSDPEGIEIFHSLMRTLYKRKRHPFKSKTYFENLLNALGKDRVRFYFAYLDGSPIATQLAIFHDLAVTAMYTATSPCHLDKKAGDLLVWHLINQGIDGGYRVFDFGGGGNPNRRYGPREYKRRFGCRFDNVGRFEFPRQKLFHAVNALYRLFLKS